MHNITYLDINCLKGHFHALAIISQELYWQKAEKITDSKEKEC